LTAHFRLPPIRSRVYLDGARGSQCTLQIPGCCTGETETVVAAHIKDEHAGRAVKASDISSCDACRACHARADGQDGHPLSKEDWLFYMLRGLQRTLENRIRRGILQLKLDPEPEPMLERKVKPRKPPGQRAEIKGTSNWPATGTQKIKSRNNLRKRDT
jgi:hypothetical protein